MRAIAHEGFASAFTIAEIGVAVFFSDLTFRLNICASLRTVTERLALRPATSAEILCFTFYRNGFVGFNISNNEFAHGNSPNKTKALRQITFLTT